MLKKKRQRTKDQSHLDPSKRSFLNKLWLGLGVLAVVELIGVVLMYFRTIITRTEAEGSKRILNAGPIEEFPINSVTAFIRGKFYLCRLEDGGFIALSLRCTHLGCSIEWEEDKKRFICPCHSSAFAMNGDVQNPPAPKALDYYPIVIEKGIIKVDVGMKLERNRFSKEQIVYV